MDVSILVIVEMGLVGIETPAHDARRKDVSILVIVEMGLVALQEIEKKTGVKRFNPCYSGNGFGSK